MKTLVMLEALTKADLISIACAQTITQSVDLLFLGEKADELAQKAAFFEGVRAVFFVKSETKISPEALDHALLPHLTSYTHIFAGANSFGNQWIPRLALLLNAPMISKVIKIISPDTFVRPLYAGQFHETLKADFSPCLFTIQTNVFAPVVQKETPKASPILPLALTFEKAQSRCLGSIKNEGDLPALSEANIVVAGGLGVKDKTTWHTFLVPLAHKLNAALGASRALVEKGVVTNAYQIGQTGKIIAPDLYIAVGISGAAQHLAGVLNAKRIVAINTDPHAPIFKVADDIWIADLKEAIPHLMRVL